MKNFSQSIREFRMNSVFVRIFLYIIILVIGSVGLVSFFSYKKSSGMMIKEVQVSNMLILEQAQKSIDKEINSLQSDLMQMALARNLNRVLYLSLEQSYQEIEVIQDSIASLSAYKSSNDYIADIWFYQEKADFVLGTGGKYQRSLFLSEVCKYAGDLNWDEIFNQGGFRILGKQIVHQGAYDVPVLVFSESLPFINKNPKGMIVVNLNETLFKKEMANSNDEKIVFNYVVDADGNVIYTNEQSYPDYKDLELIWEAVKNRSEEMEKSKDTVELSIEGKPFTIQYVKSSVFDWKYISVIPTEYITKSINQIKDVTILVSAISFILSVILTYYIIAGLYQPMNKILNYINIIGSKKSVMRHGQKDNEFTLINGIIDYVYKENQSLQDNFEKNKPMLQDKFIYDIINGQMDRKNFLTSGVEIGIELPFPYYQIIVYEIGDRKSSELKRYRKSCKEHVEEMKKIARDSLGDGCRCYFMEKNDQTIVSILNTEKSFYEFSGINDYLNNVQAYLEESLDEPYTIGVGLSYEEIDNCYLSFIDALEALNYKTVKGQNTVIYIDEVNGISSGVILYSIEKETQLITVAKSGNREVVLELLQSVFQDNLLENNISPELVDHLFHALAGTAIRTIFEMRLTSDRIFGKKEDIYTEIDSKNGLEEKVKYISYVFEMITKYVTENKQNQQSHILEKIQRHLEENYSMDISLDTVAEVVNLSTSYLSFIFKEISGKNFVDYVNEFRIEKAKQLLDETSFNVAQIAEQVGYNSANSFSKVFKKYVGISPGQYRKI
ncbi:AraC family transcriptional regulator [Lachnospiraceae bacterium MD1]|uniref:AraC family transcriptional regulator n=1 Tax=Variimorphobacter saccharofermentans TaxID=2755051 RepID=A0A839K391_9FIRM|nr:AraC family transcriptional regulator [Variimorphobacter saccharofermentans]MBB2184375.1 AraC family transcriptional regulator [Variimorphobacter saccharofermentans]